MPEDEDQIMQELRAKTIKKGMEFVNHGIQGVAMGIAGPEGDENIGQFMIARQMVVPGVTTKGLMPVAWTHHRDFADAAVKLVEDGVVVDLEQVGESQAVAVVGADDLTRTVKGGE